MKEQQFYQTNTVPLQEIIPAYQRAFAGEPWYEVGKCADTRSIKRCVGGFTDLSVGTCCGLCGNRIEKDAYEPKELESRFRSLAETRPTAWYVEKNEKGTTLAALAWKATPIQIAQEKYADNPQMVLWMQKELGDTPIMWLDEVFADRSKQPTGNLKNYQQMCLGLAQRLGTETIAYRTISPAMTKAPLRDFPGQATIFERKIDVPDRRDFIIIRRGGEKK